jgi:hypothetical protein
VVNGSCTWAAVDAGHNAFYMAAAPHVVLSGISTVRPMLKLVDRF